jgi:hypothetical protein
VNEHSVEHPQSTASQDGDDRRGSARLLRKAGVGALGGVVTAAGVVMLVTPGPGILVTLAGLGILSREFPSARSGLERIRRHTAGRRSPRTGGEDLPAEAE